MCKLRNDAAVLAAIANPAFSGGSIMMMANRLVQIRTHRQYAQREYPCHAQHCDQAVQGC